VRVQDKGLKFEGTLASLTASGPAPRDRSRRSSIWSRGQSL